MQEENVRLRTEAEGVADCHVRAAERLADLDDKAEGAIASFVEAREDITERTRATEAVRARTRQLEAICAISAEIVRELELAEVLRVISERLSEVVGYGRGGVCLWDDPAQLLIPHTKLNETGRERFGLKRGQGVAGRVADTRLGVVVNDYQTRPGIPPEVRARTKITAIMAEPLLYRDRLVGVIHMDTEDPRVTFTGHDQDLLRLVAPQAAIAIENARLYASAWRRNEELESLLRATRALMSERGVEQILEKIVAEAAAISGSVHVKLLLVDREAGVLRVGALQGTSMPKDFQLPIGTGLSGQVAATGESLFVMEPGDDPTNVQAAEDRKKGIVTYLGLPLKTREQVLGVLTFNMTTAHRYSQGELDYLGAFADQAALAVENARLFEAERRRREQLEGIRLVSTEVARELDLDRLLDLIIRRATDLTGRPVGSVFLYDSATDQLVPAAHRSGGMWVRQAPFPLGEGVGGRAAQERRGLIVNDYRNSPHASLILLEHTNITAAMAEPLLYQDRLLGVITLREVDPGKPFTDDDLEVLRLFAAQAAIAIENARLFRAAQEEVTRRARAEETLRRYNLLADQARDIVLFVHRDTGRIIEANRAAVAAYGYPLPDLLTCRIHDLRAQETRALTADQLAQADAEGILFESVHVRRDGTTFPVEISSRGTFLDGERVLLSIIRDITERKRTETSLQAHVHQLEVVRAVTAEVTRELNLDRLLDLILRRAIELAGAEAGVIMLWDEATQTLFPRLRIGEFWAHMPKRPIPLGEGVVGHVAQTRQALIINDYRSWSGARPLALSRTAITASLGEPLLYRDTLVGVIVLIHTDGKGVFAEHHGALLRLFAAQAAIGIENARLFQEQQHAFGELKRAQEELVRTEKLRALGQMSAGIAHDLNNMLAAVLGQAELLRLQVKLPEVQEALKVLSTAASDGAQVVRRLLEFGRQQPSRPLIPCNLVSLVDEALEITRPRWQDEAQEQGRLIEVRRAVEDLPRVQGNPAEIREALTNLFLNAVDAMPTGGRLTVGGCVEADATTPEAPGRVLLTVSDTGTGMTEETRRRIFDPFFTTKGFKGTGLGLAVVYGIMERHGGRIEVASTPGQGTTFTLRFQEAVLARGEAAMTTSLPPSVNAQLLLIDDEAPVRTTIASLLRAVGHTVIEADSGDRGLACLTGGAVDLVITDLGMPGMTGWEVAQRIKTLRPGLPVILLTGWGDQIPDTVRERDFVDMVLAKPVRLADLRDAIARVTAPRTG